LEYARGATAFNDGLYSVPQPSHGLLDCWINGLLQIKELCKNQHMEKNQNAYSENFLKIQYPWFFLNSNPIIQQSINPLIRHPVG
jgi:hypothetical protein